MNLEKLCPVHRGFFAMSGRVPHVPLLHRDRTNSKHGNNAVRHSHQTSGPLAESMGFIPCWLQIISLQ
jgi:hypothetical protein